MARNIEKAICDYRERASKANEKRNQYGFFTSDMEQILELAKKRSIEHPYTDILFNLICLSLEAGFEIGYRTAKREVKRQL